MRARPFPRRFFLQHAVDVARGLLGARLEKDGVGGVVVETEAYDQSEPACHAHKGERPRCRTLFLAGGHLYVYRIHQVVCANVSVGPVGHGSGVLFRALVPTHGLELVAARRATAPKRAWTDGPGKLCKALSIGLEDDGQDLVTGDGPVRLLDLGARVADEDVEVGPRVGISQAVDLPWRFRARVETARSVVSWGRSSREVASTAQLNALLDTIEASSVARPQMVHLAVPPDRDVISLGLGRDLSVLTLTPGHGDPPYFISKGKPGRRASLAFCLGGELTEYSGRAGVPRAEARAAANEFFETRERPRCVAWEET